jgi:hypothetical protein
MVLIMLRKRSRDDRVTCEWLMRAAACVSGLMAATLALPIDATLAAEASFPLKTIVARDKQVDALAKIFSVFDAGAGDEAAHIRQILGRLLPAKASKTPAVLEEPESRIVFLMAAGNDPRFKQWQKDADERLKQEAADTAFKQHPFAIAHPDQSVVVCEAGCLIPDDEIVYLAAIVPARLLTVLSDEQADPVSSAGTLVTAALTLESSDLSCVAGCYDRPKPSISAAGSRTKRDIPTPLSERTDTLHAQANERLPLAQRFTHSLDVTLSDCIRSRLQIGHNGAIIEQRASTYEPVARAGPALSGQSIEGAQQRQRTNVKFSRFHEAGRSSMLRVGLQMRHHNIAIAQTQLARRK